jgi:hypothetical protein
MGKEFKSCINKITQSNSSIHIASETHREFNKFNQRKNTDLMPIPQSNLLKVKTETSL